MRRPPNPLQWPAGQPRTPSHRRQAGRFNVAMSYAIDDLLLELDRVGAADAVITSDLPVNTRTGLPYSTGNGRTDEPAIAVWFVLDGHERVMCCDIYDTPVANIRAIGKTIEATRGISRWGVASQAQAFAGFAALPPPSAPEPWRDVFRVTYGANDTDIVDLTTKASNPQFRTACLKVVQERYRRLMKAAHPDRGGDSARAARINTAYEQAQAELGG